MVIAYRDKWQQCRAWLTRDAHRARALALRVELTRAFTEHPGDTGETYAQHLWFATTMAARFLYSLLVLLVHGLFPFLLTRAASSQIEIIYRIMKSRIPQSRRDVIDADMDYSV